MFKSLLSAAAAVALLSLSLVPISGPAFAETKKEQSEAQKAAAEHRKQCSEEWKQAKADKKVEKGLTWPKFNGACMKRLSKT